MIIISNRERRPVPEKSSVSFILRLLLFVVTVTAVISLSGTKSYAATQIMSVGKIDVIYDDSKETVSVVKNGDTYTLTAIPNQGYVFVYWSLTDGTEINANPTEITTTQHMDVLLGTHIDCTGRTMDVTWPTGDTLVKGNTYTVTAMINSPSTTDTKFVIADYRSNSGGTIWPNLQYSITDENHVGNNVFTLTIPVDSQLTQYTLEIRNIQGWPYLSESKTFTIVEPNTVSAGPSAGSVVASATKADNGKKNAHTHSYSWVVTKYPTSTSDGEEVYQCSCGDVARTSILPAISAFEEEVINKIKNAPANGVIEVETRLFNSFGIGVRDALVSRPDVTLKVSFLSEGYKGQLLKVTIPAGIDRKALFEESGWLGLCWYGSTHGYDQ